MDIMFYFKRKSNSCNKKEQGKCIDNQKSGRDTSPLSPTINHAHAKLNHHFAVRTTSDSLMKKYMQWLNGV